jgi:hypothetical protein
MFQIRSFIKNARPRTRIAIAVAAALAITSCVNPPESISQRTADDPQQEIASLAYGIESGRVRFVEVLNIPSDIMTSHAISPQELQTQFSYKVTIQRPISSRQGKSLASALKETSVSRTRRTTDLRWGVVFAFDNNQVKTVYLDGFGKFGQIGDVQVSFDGGLYAWLQTFSSCLR